MDLEARSLQPSVKAALLAKLREYKTDFNNLKSQVKRITSPVANHAARDELLEPGMAETLTVFSPYLCVCVRVYVLMCALLHASMFARHNFLVHGMGHLIMRQTSNDQRGRLLMTTERLNQSTDRVKESRRTMLETEELGVSILQDLHQQRQSLLHAHNTVCVLCPLALVTLALCVTLPQKA